MRRQPRPLHEEGLKLIEMATEAHLFLLAYEGGARGFCPMNAERELTSLIVQAKTLRKRMAKLKPEGFKVSFRK